MADEVRSTFSLDIGPALAKVRQVDQAQRLVDDRTTAAQQRVQQLTLRLKQLEADAAAVDRVLQRGGTKVVKAVGRAAATYLVGEALSEIGIPEAAAPLVRVGTAALSGALLGSSGGPVGTAVGAGVFATIQSVKELAGYVRSHSEKQDKLQAKALEMQERMRQFDLEFVRLAERTEYLERQRRAELDAEIDAKFKRDTDELDRLIALGEN